MVMRPEGVSPSDLLSVSSFEPSSSSSASSFSDQLKDLMLAHSDARLTRGFNEVAHSSISQLGLDSECRDIPWPEIRQSYRLWESRARDRGFEVTMALGGSLGSDLYWGPKLRGYSSNPDCPPEFDKIIECDGRIILHRYNGKPVDPHDPDVVDAFKSITGGQKALAPEFANRWNREIQVSRIYSYKPLGGGVGLEFEMCLVPSFFVDPASYWRFAFTKEEREQQAFFRASLRSLGAAKREISSEKNPETMECRWRVVSAYAIRHLLNSNQMGFVVNALPEGYIDRVRKELEGPFAAEPPKLLAPLVKSWLEGEYRRDGGPLDPACGVFRPSREELPSKPVRVRVGELFPETLGAVPPPLFVGLADIIQSALQRARQQGEKMLD